MGASSRCRLDRPLRAFVNLIAIVLNWNGGADLLAALDSLEGIPTICVDNDSSDGSDRLAADRLPHVELIRTGANLGFAAGNNVGIERALERGADWVLLMNNDAVAEPGLKDALEAAADARPDAGMLACKLLNLDGSVQFQGAHFNSRLGYSPRPASSAATPSDTGRADGAGVAVSRQAIERAGLLDEALFMYVEDVDWSLRIRNAGFAVVLVPDAVIRHKGSAASGGGPSTSSLYYDTRNTIAVSERYAPLPPGPRGLRRGVVVGAHLAQAVRWPGRLGAVRAVLAGWRDARAGRLGQRSSS